MADQGKILSAVSEYVEAETAELKAQIEQLTAQRDSARGDVADLTTKVAELRAQLDALEQKMLVGISYPALAKGVAPAPYEARAQVARIFFQTLKGANIANDPRVQRAIANDVPAIVISWFEEDVEAVRTALATVPTGSFEKVYACFKHEPEDDMASTKWQALWAVQSPVIRAAGLIPVQILMAWTLDPGSKRDQSAWTLPPGTVDVYMFDAYVDKIAPATQVSRIVAYCKSIGATRTGIAETGSIVSDAQRATKLAALLDAMDASSDVQFEVACYWNQKVTNGADFRLNDADADAWFG